ncbi:uncharacterized protein GGS22DRAFT_148890 [Annulohypoxylon maeteangense]|uniref:uncharacterized protein n=1 Tax=Annulohypoxylon maeteangense TaxID=1927788 RepID=UPI002007E705|nr:uncharacterized protein GGS22DRAFT_148890 [Annulohypoxylon maeteangense]KAI0889681.1 hypothetical protein GGS22DRAFT_148890 [Annulohypoxylon maeteangense]
MQVSEFTEDHPYWGTLRQSQTPNINPGMINPIEDTPMYGLDGPAQPITNHEQYPSKPQQTGQTVGGRRLKGMSASGRNRGPAREKRFGLADPVVKYADAAAVAGTAPAMTPTESESKVSYHTVQQLLPYRREFQKAGLAVTSSEQRRESPVKPSGRRKPMKHSLKVVVESVGTSSDSDEQDETKSEDSCSSSGSFVEFSPGGSLIEALPNTHFVPKQQPPSQGKKGIFPWLKRKSPAREMPPEQPAPQPPRPPARNVQIQSRVRTTDPHNVRGLRKSHAFKDLPSLPPVPATPTKPSLRPTRPPVTAPAPKRSSLRTHQFVDVKQNQNAPRPELANSHAGSGPGPRQSTLHTGLRRRDGAAPRVPRPETIEEEKENSPVRPVRTTARLSPLPEPKGTPALSTTIDQQLRAMSSQTTPSSVPSLPYPARHASRRPSSLERALDEVSEQLNKMERQADTMGQLCSRPATLLEKTNQKETHSFPPESHQQQPSVITPSHRLKSTEEVIFMNGKPLPTKSPGRKLKKPLPLPPKPTQNSPSPPHKQPLPSPPVDKTLPRLPKTEDLLNDLDVFFDYDDADINDRDVIKGLQVAIYAAADNVYDALIRDKTGLRIRRFLADLRAVGEMHQESPKDQRNRGLRKSPMKR